MSAHVTIEISGDFCLSAEELFPDGVPETITLEAVVAAVKTAGNVRNLITDWNLVPGVDVTIAHPSADRRNGWYYEHAEVWG